MPYADVNGLHLLSLGGRTAYEMLVAHPDRIRRAVVASADHRNDRSGEAYEERLPTEADFAAMREAYAAVAPDPSHFEAFTDTVAAMVQGCGGWSDGQLGAIEAPVLVLIGDTDFILIPNAARAAELLPRGQLAVLPGTTHMDIARSDLVVAVVDSFLRQETSAELRGRRETSGAPEVGSGTMAETRR